MPQQYLVVISPGIESTDIAITFVNVGDGYMRVSYTALSGQCAVHYIKATELINFLFPQ